MDNETVEVIGELMQTSERAVCIKFVDARGTEIEQWFPRSQISDQARLDGDKQVSCRIPQWLAEDRGVV